jgi:hypothetical protein
MTSAIMLNAIGATVLVGGWTFAVLHAHRALAADERRPAASWSSPMTERGQLAQVSPVPTRRAPTASRAA